MKPGQLNHRRLNHAPPLPFKEKKHILQFPPNSNEFSDEGIALLDGIIDQILQYTSLEIHVNGYTDSSGELEFNRQLSKFRANVVKSYLVGNGVSAHKIEIAGLGPANPIAPNDTLEGRRQNRRVEIILRRIENTD